MSKLTPQQIDRALGIGEAVVALATDVWKARKTRQPKTTKRKPTK